MKWEKKEILVSLLCVFPSLLLIIATLFIVPRVAGQKSPAENLMNPIVDMQDETDMSDTVESVSSDRLREDMTLETDQLETIEMTKVPSQPMEPRISEGMTEGSQTIDFIDLTTPEKTESSATPEGASESDNVISTEASEESNQTGEPVKSTETTEKNY